MLFEPTAFKCCWYNYKLRLPILLLIGGCGSVWSRVRGLSPKCASLGLQLGAHTRLIFTMLLAGGEWSIQGHREGVLRSSSQHDWIFKTTRG